MCETGSINMRVGLLDKEYRPAEATGDRFDARMDARSSIAVRRYDA